MSQSRFSIVLVGVSALLRRPLVSRLRPADGERSSWVVFAARGCRFDSGFRWAGWPSGSLLPLFGMHRFGVAAGRVGLRAHRFRFSACAASEWPLGELAFGLTTSAFRHAPLRSGRWASWFFRLLLRRFRSAGWPSGSLLPLFGTHRFGDSAGRVRSSAFRFGDCRSASWPSDSRLPLFGMRRFGVALGELVLPPSASEIAARRVGLRAHASGLPSAGWPSGSRLPLFGMRRSAPPHRRREGRRSTPTRHLFHFKTLISTC